MTRVSAMRRVLGARLRANWRRRKPFVATKGHGRREMAFSACRAMRRGCIALSARFAGARSPPKARSRLSRSRASVRRLDRTACLLPGAEAARDVGDGLQPHALCRLRGERRAQTAGAEEHEFLVLGEDGLVVRALRVDPEFQHAARAMEGARHPAVPPQLPN